MREAQHESKSEAPAAAPQAAGDESKQTQTSFTNQGPIPAVAPSGPERPSASDVAFGAEQEQEGAGAGDHGASPRLRVTARRLNVRTSPTAKNRTNIIGGLDRNDEVVPGEREGKWVRITYNAQPAYVHGGYLEDATQKAGEPEVAPVRKPAPKTEEPGEQPQAAAPTVEDQGPVAVELNDKAKEATTEAAKPPVAEAKQAEPAPEVKPEPARPQEVAQAQQQIKAEPQPDAAVQAKNDHAHLPALQTEYRKLVQLYTNEKIEKLDAINRFVTFDKSLHGGTTSVDGTALHASLWTELLVIAIFRVDKEAKEKEAAKPAANTSAASAAPAAQPDSGAPAKGDPTVPAPQAKFDGTEGPLVNDLHALKSAEADRIAGMIAAIDQKSAALGKKASMNEERGGDRQKMVAQVADLRAALDRLELPGMDKVQVAALKARVYRHIADVSGYYSQGRNVDILEEFKAKQTTRTCNITSLAMALENLGVSASSYKKMPTARRVAGYFMNEEEKAAAAGVTAGEGDVSALRKASGIENLRLPDFLELAAISESCNASSSDKEVNAARWEVWDKIKSWSFLGQLAAQFGVSANTDILRSGGKKIGNQVKSWGDEKTQGKSNRRLDMESYANARHMVAKLEAEGKTDSDEYKVWSKKLDKANTAGVKASLEGEKAPIELDDYRDAVTAQLSPALDGGRAIIVGLSGHYVRFQGFAEDGVIVDDPGRWDSGASRHVTWAEARAMGYFHHFMFLG